MRLPTAPSVPLLAAVAGALSTTIAASIVYRTWLWLRYRPVTPQGPYPSVSVVIPAFNEGANVARAIQSVAGSDYPHDRLEVICVDDGSADDTYVHAASACEGVELPAKTLRLETNQGKRIALYTGMRDATGDVLVTLDSDSRLEAGALRHLVAPFAEATIGASAGKVLVENRNQNWLTRLLWVQYVVGFDFTRAYQSTFRTVFCAPGACAAYRRSVVTGLLDRWRDQRFFGARCTNGDDHHLTNLILESGHDTVYQSAAATYTVVPGNYNLLVRMFTRWARSNIRESFVYLRFGLRRAWSKRQPLPLFDALLRVIINVLRPFGFIGLVAALLVRPDVLLGGVTASATAGLIYSCYYLRYERSLSALLAIPYAVFSFLALQWIYPVAFLTVRHNRWMTR